MVLTKIKKKAGAVLMAVIVGAAGLPVTPQAVMAQATPIEIDSVEELLKIGTDTGYPMNADYVLTADIDCKEVADFKPIGNQYTGVKGTVAGSNVFSGTFDGQGHVIRNINMNLGGSIAGDGIYGQVGLFSVIAGDSEENRAKVCNLVLQDVSIQTDFSDGLASIGCLAGDVNGYATIDQVAVVSGTLNINPTANCDTVGAGGLIGECRTEDMGIGNGHISITNVYNGADIYADGTREDLIYVGGIVGRIAKSAVGTLSACVNTGTIQYAGYDGYGITSAVNHDAGLLTGCSYCYYLDNEAMADGNSATAIKEQDLTGGTLLEGLDGTVWQAEAGSYVAPKAAYESSAKGVLYLRALTLGFAEGESASGVKTEIALPASIGEEALNWNSSNEEVLRIEDGKAIADTMVIGVNTDVILTATTTSQMSKQFKVTVLTECEQIAGFASPYAKVGEPLVATVSQTEDLILHYEWKVDGVKVGSDASGYTPQKTDLEKFITVTIWAEGSSMKWNLSTYCSELPVVYVDTNDGYGVDSNTQAKDAHIKVQGNDEFSDTATMYEGDTTIKGRGNSTWSYAVQTGGKRPYKLKLADKANLLGLGKNGKGTNKHWVLLANLIDHTNIRNQVVNGLAREIGMESIPSSTSVVLVLNGEYQGIYELSEHIRVGSSRVDVYDWEDTAGEIAKKIAKKDSTVDKDALTDYLEQNLLWATDGKFTYNNKEYIVSEYYSDPIPDITGGLLLDMDFRSTNDDYKYISKFQTKHGVPMFFRAPEYAKTNQKMVDFAKNYLDAYETAIESTDFTTTYNGEEVHYTDLYDLDSLLKYWLIVEYTNNWDSMKNSTYMYKPIDGKMKMGPTWDYDWAFGNINMYSMTGPFVYDNWHTTLTGINSWQGGFMECDYQGKQMYRYLVKDPYFVTKAYELYQANRHTTIENISKDGGTIDTLWQKYKTASDANDAKWASSYGRYRGFAFVNGQQVSCESQLYDAATQSMKTFIEKRLAWMDAQCASPEKMYQSLGNTVNNKLKVSLVKNGEKVKAVASINDSSVKYVEILVNGVLQKADSKYIAVDGQKASVEIPAELLEDGDSYNTVEVIGLTAANTSRTVGMNFSNVKTGEIKAEEPVEEPSETPSVKPSEVPSEIPSVKPSEVPSETPSVKPSETPSVKPMVCVQKIKLSATQKELQVYGTYTLKATVSPSNAANKKVKFQSSNPSVASVSNSGKITAKKSGTAKIYVSATDGSGIKVMCKVTVKKPSLSITAAGSVKAGKTLTLKAKPLGLKGTVRWSLDSKGKKYAKLSKNSGTTVKLKAQKKGTVKVTASCGGKKVTKTIKVK